MYSDSIAGQFAQSIRYFIGYLSKRVPVKLCAEVCFASPMSDHAESEPAMPNF